MTSRLVYSTEGNNTCPTCNKALHKCKCEAGVSADTTAGKLTIRRETKGRGGKVVTVVENLPLGKQDLKRLAKELRTHCGTGGAIKSGVIEIQGDHRESLKAYLASAYSDLGKQ